MKMMELHDLLAENRFFKDLAADDLMVIAGCGRTHVFEGGTTIAETDQDADVFYVVREGKLRIEQHRDNAPPFPLQTVGSGDVVGWSWLFPPYTWSFDVVALEKTHVLALDGGCLRAKCEKNHSLGFRLMKKFALIMHQRLHAHRLQIMDVYGKPGA